MIKKYILTIALFAISYVGFSQTSTTPAGTASPTATTPTAQLRIPDRITDFGQNLPAGTQIYVLSDSTLWQTKVPIASTKTINSAYVDLLLINRSATYLVESFEAPNSSSTYTLSKHPINGTGGITVMMNGAALRPGTDYTCLGVILTIISNQLQYDKFIVSYSHTTN
ncbi:hypothetical protein [Aquirufa sp. A-Brett2-W8]|jgi:hypothetical protein